MLTQAGDLRWDSLEVTTKGVQGRHAGVSFRGQLRNLVRRFTVVPGETNDQVEIPPGCFVSLAVHMND